MSPEAKSVLDTVIASVRKKYGKNAVMHFNDKTEFDPENIISSGSIGLDIALGVGGYKRGRIVEIFGLESCGKTSLCLHAIAGTQKRGIKCMFVDTEHGLDPTYMKALDVNLDDLLIAQPNFAEEALGLVDMMAKSGEVGLIVIDSVAALVPRAELEGDMGQSHVGLQARLMSQAMRKLAGVASNSNCLIIFTNQIRQKVGVMFGSPNTQTGGMALRFYASQRLEMTKIGQIKNGEEIIGNKVKIKVVKNKLSSPFKQVELDIMFGIGIDKLAEVADLAVEDNIIIKSGAWYSYESNSIAQGKQSLVELLKEDEDFRNKITKQVLEARGLAMYNQASREQDVSE